MLSGVAISSQEAKKIEDDDENEYEND